MFIDCCKKRCIGALIPDLGCDHIIAHILILLDATNRRHADKFKGQNFGDLVWHVAPVILHARWDKAWNVHLKKR